MKISDKLLWFGLGAVFGGIFISLVFFRISVNPVLADTMMDDTGSDKVITKTYDMAHFDQVKASGNLEITLVQKDAYGVKITGPEYALNRLDVTKHGPRLSLGRKRYFKSDNPKLKVDIAMPALNRLNISGSVKAHLAGFQSPRLKLITSGSTKITGKNNKIGYMSIDGSGATTLAFFDNPVITAEVDLAGSSLVFLTMDKGDLRGKISGSGKLVYTGTLNHQDVRISGAGSVVHKRPDAG